MDIVTLGIDLAKNVFAVHGVEATGKAAVIRPIVAGDRLLELLRDVLERLPAHPASRIGALLPHRWQMSD